MNNIHRNGAIVLGAGQPKSPAAPLIFCWSSAGRCLVGVIAQHKAQFISISEAKTFSADASAQTADRSLVNLSLHAAAEQPRRRRRWPRRLHVLRPPLRCFPLQGLASSLTAGIEEEGGDRVPWEKTRRSHGRRAGVAAGSASTMAHQRTAAAGRR